MLIFPLYLIGLIYENIKQNITLKSEDLLENWYKCCVDLEKLVLNKTIGKSLEEIFLILKYKY